jgi:hypothetical protein
MKYAVEMGSDVVIRVYVPSFTNIISGIKELIGGIAQA